MSEQSAGQVESMDSCSRWRRDRVRVLVVYWVVQAALACVAWGAQAASIDGTSGFWGRFGQAMASPALALLLIPMALITAAQAVVLLPWGTPASRGAGVRVPWFHHALAGLAITGLVVIVAVWVLLVLEAYEVVDRIDTSDLVWSVGVALVVWVLASIVFGVRYPLGVPVGVSVLIAAAGAATLVLCAALAITGCIELLVGHELRNTYFLAIAGVFLVSWTIATPLLWRFVKRRPADTALSRIASMLFFGTCIEVAASIPIDVMIRRKTECYCGEATFWSLSISWGLGSLALGPMVFLIPFSQRRKRWYAGRCEVCGYDMSGLPRAERCPECGAGWRAGSSGAA